MPHILQLFATFCGPCTISEEEMCLRSVTYAGLTSYERHCSRNCIAESIKLILRSITVFGRIFEFDDFVFDITSLPSLDELI